MSNKLFFGDNLDVMRRNLKDESVDLIYLDPPFNSQASYNVLFKENSGADSQAQAEAFQDTWLWGETSALAYDDAARHGGDVASLLRVFKSWLGDAPLMAYLAMMAVRLIELKRVIKPHGSIYLHCDPTASHYIKLIMDSIFNQNSYKNEIVWLRSKNPKGSQHKSRKYGPATDSLLYYADGTEYFYNPDAIRVALSADEIALKYPSKDEIGPFADGPILRSASMGARPNLVYEYKGFTPGLAGWRMEKAALAELDAKGNLAWTKTGAPRRKLRPEDDRGDPVGSFWGDIPPLNSQAKERLGYPTQKPVALLERIITASSHPEAVIFDPFCGCGTTVHAAQKLGRQWIGIDVAHYAITLIDNRIKKYFPASSYGVFGRPTDLGGAFELAKRNKYQFQWWACWLLGVQTYETKKGADRGIDGNMFFQNGPFGFGRIIVSVKGGLNVGPAMVRELAGVVQREGADMGVLILLAEPTRAMVSDAAGCGFVEKSAHGRLPRIQISTVENLLARRMPKLPPLPLPERIAPAKTKKDKDQLELLLPFEGAETPIERGVVVDPRFMRTA